MDDVKWVYDEVINKNTQEIVAIMYHPKVAGLGHPNCLAADGKVLANEGLTYTASMMFDTLAEAQQHAWKDRARFAKDLD